MKWATHDKGLASLGGVKKNNLTLKGWLIKSGFPGFVCFIFIVSVSLLSAILPGSAMNKRLAEEKRLELIADNEKNSLMEAICITNDKTPINNMKKTAIQRMIEILKIRQGILPEDQQAQMELTILDAEQLLEEEKKIILDTWSHGAYGEEPFSAEQYYSETFEEIKTK